MRSSLTHQPLSLPLRDHRPATLWRYLSRFLVSGFIVPLIVGATVGDLLSPSTAHASTQTGPDATIESVDLDTSFLEASTVFEEPFQLLGEPSTSHDEETAVLREILTDYLAENDAEALEEFLEFTVLYPDSAWRVAVLTNIGLAYRRTGYTSRALSLFEQAWEAAWDVALYRADGSPDQVAATLGSRAAGELAELYARLGRTEALEDLLLELDQDILSGPATAQVTRASEGLSKMLNQPDRAFRCGPMAVGSILTLTRPEDLQARATINAFGSTPNGLPLTEVARLAQTVGLGLQLAYREPGAPLPVPAVVHWRANHFAAILQVKSEQVSQSGPEAFYQVQDPTFGHRRWLSQRAMDDESSGYFLIAQGALPLGWRTVSDAEGNAVWGSGYTDSSDPEENSEDSEKAKDGQCSKGMAVYNVHSLLISLNIVDTPLWYTPPLGPPVEFRVTYNERDSYQPAVFQYSNLGPKWTFNYLSYVTDTSTAFQTVTVYRRGGGQETYEYNTAQQYYPHYKSRAILTRTTSPTLEYRRTLPDGTIEVFSKATTSSTARKVFLTKLIDPQGQALEFTYDANFRMTKITDAIGQETLIAYHPTQTYKIVSVTDPFGRVAGFEYTNGKLTKISDTRTPTPITSTFQYTVGDFINQMTTPYGTTSFHHDAQPLDTINRWITITDPLSQKERVEFRNQAPGVDEAVDRPDEMDPMPAGDDQDWRNTFFWDKRFYAEFGATWTTHYNQAKLTHWLHLNPDVASGIVENHRAPLEVGWTGAEEEPRVFNTYPNQPYENQIGSFALPDQVGQFLDDGTQQITRYTYNDLGLVTKVIAPDHDPSGSPSKIRITLYIYAANGIDLLEVRQMKGESDSELLAKYTYNAMHLPLTFQDASGNITSYEYNPHGQLTSITNAKEEHVYFDYNLGGTEDYGYLKTIRGDFPNAPITLTYNTKKLLWKTTNAEGDVVTREYDDLQRLTKVIYPDTTYEETTFDKLDPLTTRDRAGRVTTYLYNALRQLTQTTVPTSTNPPQSQVTQYGWCGCGSLTEMIDPRLKTTTWDYDLRGRLIQKVYPDSSHVDYEWENASDRLKKVIWPSNTSVLYSYDRADHLIGIYHTQPLETPLLETEFYYLDPYYDRLTSMADDSGETIFSYRPVPASDTAPPVNGANQLWKLDGPLSDDTVTYTYDALGRRISTQVGTSSTAVFSRTFDGLGRVSTETDPLGAFTLAYHDTPTSNPTIFPHRLKTVTYPTAQKTTYDYLGATGDRRLELIDHRTPSNAVLSTSTYSYWNDGSIKNWTQAPERTVLDHHLYDLANQLLQVKAGENGNPRFGFTYDPAGNLTSQSVTTTTTTTTSWASDDVNQIDTQTISGNTISFLYNADGGLENDGTRTYLYDAQQRLVKITRGGDWTELTYNGFDQLIQIKEKVGSTISDRYYIWCEGRICEERDLLNSNAVLRRFSDRGFRVEGTTVAKYYYTRDHLGSIRELTDNSGALVARYDYDPYGLLTQTYGSPLSPPFGYAGYFYNEANGLNLTWYRAYDPRIGRWLSRDPIGEAGGRNLYGYVGGDPVNKRDPLGLMKLPSTPGGLPPEWVHDPTHKDPFGERYRHPSGDMLDFHKGRTGKGGFKEKDHWHHNDGKYHYPPGYELPDPEPKCEDEGGDEFNSGDKMIGNEFPDFVPIMPVPLLILPFAALGIEAVFVPILTP